ncbi:Axonemal Inner Arm I1 Intermediate Chain Dynein [Achlya hypogyna]|uniref:Dynein axonemal intermediate chain 4 n=1 Tax=Achlya hypogyna TaxID=1202772 RepID=A0A1V9Y9L7_ACHHY|nr:Axonemal Inner Arm I1 Intermediate Chain Dynein [Achlya hypogyna]
MSTTGVPRVSSKNVGASKKIVGSKARVNEASSRSRVIGASQLSQSSRKVAGGSGAGGGSQAAQVYLDGVNVTPQSLLYTRIKTTDKGARRPKKGPDDGASSSNTSVTSLGGAEHDAAPEQIKSLDAILSGPSPLLGAGAAAAKPPVGGKKMDTDDADADGALVTGLDDALELAPNRPSTDRKPRVEDSSKKGVAGPVTILFSETPTIMLFELLSVCVGQDTPAHGVIVNKNKKYLEMCSAKKGSDNYVENRTQTLQLAQKTKEVMTAPPATRDVACTVTDWDIFDWYVPSALGLGAQTSDEILGNEHEDGAEQARLKPQLDADNVDAQLARQVDEIVNASLASPGCLLAIDGPDVILDLKARQRALGKPKPSTPGHHPPHGPTGATLFLCAGTTSLGALVGTHDSKANYSRVSKAVSTTSSTSNSQVLRRPGAANSTAVLSTNDVNSNSGDISSSGSQADISRSSTNSDGNSLDGGKHENAYAAANTNVDLGEIIATQKTSKVLGSSALDKLLRVLERAVQQNVYHDRHLLYRNFPLLSGTRLRKEAQPPPSARSTAKSSSHPGSPFDTVELEKLWGFRCGLTDGRTVTCLAWNPVNDDLLAVAYGHFEAGDTSDGLVLFWSLKNPEFPERIYVLPCGATSIDFSRSQPYMLAVGFHDGVVALYDTRKDDTDPVLSSENNSGSHLDAVWQVEWVHKGSERGENIVSISSDGRVTEWSMKKGLSFSDLMTLKRVANPLLGSEARIDGVIARQASGHCIAFAEHDSSVYFVGTEDGNIHKCSCSYNEQYLETYFGHTAAVYSVKMSPFWHDVFLSCSADWSVKLWHHAEQHEMLNFRSVDLFHGVYGIGWCPNDATIFGSVTEDGRIEIWDLEQSILDPIMTHFPKDDVTLKCTTISFAPSSPVLVVGDSTGEVGVYRVPILAEGRCDGQSKEEQVERLKRAVQPHQVT